MTAATAAADRRPTTWSSTATGGFWFTDHGCIDAGRPPSTAALYYAKADGVAISRQRDDLISPNGVGLSPDEQRASTSPTPAAAALGVRRRRARACSAPRPGSRRAGWSRNLPGYQLLDSLAVEAGGKVCVATIVNGGITAFDPDGDRSSTSPVPDLIITNICFGGADMRDAWITASATGKLYKARWPRPGLKLAFNA